MADVILKAEHLKIGFFSERHSLFEKRKRNEVLKDLSFTMEKGEVLGLVGESGCGKSTLAKVILGLLKPTEGKIEISEELKKAGIGYLPQQTAVQKDFPASVREIILSGCQNKCGIRPFYSRKEKQAASEMMEKLQITHISNKCFRELSGGQQQRVLLARALCATSKILLLDEPVTGLDPKASEEMYQFISRINREEDITIIMISHDVDNAINDATRVMKIGKDISIRSAEDDR